MLHGLLLHTGMTSAGGTLLSGREACDDACSAQKPGPETRAQPSLWHGAESKPVQLISIGLENFESGDWSAKEKTDVQAWCAKFGGKKKVSYDFACKDGCYSSDYVGHCDMMLDSLFANSGDVIGKYDRSEVVLLDCRSLYNADHDFRLAHHAGYHPKNLEGLLLSPEWSRFWQDAHGKIIAALQRRNVSKLLVVCYCKKGRHRSVGVRAQLHHCLQAIGMECLASNDLCSGRLWGHMCDGAHARCSDCHPCGGQLGELADCVRVTALEHWLALENSALARVEELCAGSSSTGQVKTRRATANKICNNILSHEPSATEHPAKEVVRSKHMQSTSAAQCAPVSEHTSPASGSSELVPWLSSRPLSPTHTIAIWQVQFPKQWIEYEPAINTDIEQQFQNSTNVAHFQQCKSRKRDWWDDYTIAFDRMEQRNTRSGCVRKVRRIERSACAPQSTAPLC